MKLRSVSILVVLVIALVWVEARGGVMAFTMTSTAFGAGQSIPKKYSCDGPDVSPQLAWKEAPAGTKSYALIADDPDAPLGTWVHWVLFNVPGDTQELAEGVEKKNQLANGALQGKNDFGNVGYGGPCPPGGSTHRYFFKLYALDGKLDLKAGTSKADIERAMKGHALGQAELMGKFGH
jgi:Raf kinase inhibitor-like YbhB/YbcL family protein